MKILVGIKHVPDTETRIKVGSDGKSIDEAGVKWIISPYDEYALEQALSMKESAGEGEVILVCAGRPAALSTLRQGLAMGADRGLLISDERFERSDALVRARALAAVARTESVELILLGKYGVATLPRASRASRAASARTRRCRRSCSGTTNSTSRPHACWPRAP